MKIIQSLLMLPSCLVLPGYHWAAHSPSCHQRSSLWASCHPGSSLEPPVIQGPACESPAIQGPDCEPPAIQGPDCEPPAIQGPALSLLPSCEPPIVQGPACVTPVTGDLAIDLSTPPAFHKVLWQWAPVIPVVATQSADEIPASLAITLGSSSRPPWCLLCPNCDSWCPVSWA